MSGDLFGAGHDGDGFGHVDFFGSTTAARRPRRWMWMRSATSNTWGMLWLIRMTGKPRSRRSRIILSTCADSFTPSAAVGSSRMMTLLPNAAARATATAWRWPPDSVSTAWRHVLDGADAERLIDCLGSIAHATLVEHSKDRTERTRPALFATEEHVRRDVERRCNCERLVHGFDTGSAGILGAAETDRLSLKQHRALVGHHRPR